MEIINYMGVFPMHSLGTMHRVRVIGVKETFVVMNVHIQQDLS